MVTLRAEYDAIVINQVPRNWVRKLGAIEGDRLLGACRKRLEAGTSHD
jgi:hypothetical protein